MSGIENTGSATVEAVISLPDEKRRLRWPTAVALIIGISALFWTLIFQLTSWLGAL